MKNKLKGATEESTKYGFTFYKPLMKGASTLLNHILQVIQIIEYSVSRTFHHSLLKLVIRDGQNVENCNSV
jgi:hypothetical protein